MNRNSIVLLLTMGHFSFCAAPSAAHAQPIERKWYLGVESHPTTMGYEVRSVTPGSPAFHANLHRGDYIKKVGEIEVGYVDHNMYYPLASALNETDGKAALQVYFVSEKKEVRRYEVSVELEERDATGSSPKENHISDNRQTLDNSVSVPSSTATEVSMDAQPDASYVPNIDERPNRDERGVVDDRFYSNPALPSETDDSATTDGKKERD